MPVGDLQYINMYQRNELFMRANRIHRLDRVFKCSLAKKGIKFEFKIGKQNAQCFQLQKGSSLTI